MPKTAQLTAPEHAELISESAWAEARSIERKRTAAVELRRATAARDADAKQRADLEGVRAALLTAAASFDRTTPDDVLLSNRNSQGVAEDRLKIIGNELAKSQSAVDAAMAEVSAADAEAIPPFHTPIAQLVALLDLTKREKNERQSAVDALNAKIKTTYAAATAESSLDACAKLCETCGRLRSERDSAVSRLATSSNEESELEFQIANARQAEEERREAPAKAAAERAKRAAADERASALAERYRNEGEQNIRAIIALMVSELRLPLAIGRLPDVKAYDRPRARGLMLAPNFYKRLRLPRIPFFDARLNGRELFHWSEYSTPENIRFNEPYLGIEISAATLSSSGRPVADNLRDIENRIYVSYEVAAKKIIAMLAEFAADNRDAVEGVDTAARRLADPSWRLGDQRKVNVPGMFALPHLSGPDMFWSSYWDEQRLKLAAA